jgi:hypothetical protein
METEMTRDDIALLEKRWSNCKYKPEYDQLLLNHLSKGLSFMSFDVPGGVAYSTLRTWCKRFPSFAQAREIGEKKRLQLLEGEGIKMVKGGNAVVWKTLMSQYGLAEKVEVNHNVGDSPHMAVPASLRYMRLQKLKELHQRVSLEESKKDEVIEHPVKPVDLEREIDLDELFD